MTLVETIIALAVAAIVAAIALPSFSAAIQRSRRADAYDALARVRLAQERYRSNHAAYASLAQLGVAASSPAGHYAIGIASPTATGYAAFATAAGAQHADAACRHLRVVVDGLDVRQASGADAEAANGDAANRACWNR